MSGFIIICLYEVPHGIAKVRRILQMIEVDHTMLLMEQSPSFNTLTSMQYFYSIFGPMSVDRLPGTIKGPFKAIRCCLEG